MPGVIFTIGTGASGWSLPIVLASDNEQDLEGATRKLEAQIRAFPRTCASTVGCNYSFGARKAVPS